MKMEIWKLNDIHPIYGKVVMMRTIEGEPYRFFENEGSISMIPLETLRLMDNEEWRSKTMWSVQLHTHWFNIWQVLEMQTENSKESMIKQSLYCVRCDMITDHVRYKDLVKCTTCDKIGRVLWCKVAVVMVNGVKHARIKINVKMITEEESLKRMLMNLALDELYFIKGFIDGRILTLEKNKVKRR